MGDARFGVFSNIFFNALPPMVLIANSLTPHTDRKKSLKGFDFPGLALNSRD